MASEHKDYNNKSSMSSSIRFGLIASILMIILTMSFYWISGAGSRPVIVWNHIVLLIIMYSGVKAYKKTKKDEVISFKQCYTSGLIIGLSAAFIFGVFMMIYTKITISFFACIVLSWCHCGLISVFEMKPSLKGE